VGRRLVRIIRVVAVVFVIGGVLAAVVALFDRLWRHFRREQGDETTEVTGSGPHPRGSRSRRMQCLVITPSRTNAAPHGHPGVPESVAAAAAIFVHCNVR
jgi:hypothetical protein